MLRPEFRKVEASARIGFSSARTEGRGLAFPALDAPVDTWLTALQQHVTEAFSEIGRLRNDLNAELHALTARSEVESQERRSGDERILAKLEEFSVGGLHVEAVGVAWIMIGLVLATAPDELSRLLALLVPSIGA